MMMSSGERFAALYPLFGDDLCLEPGETVMARAPMRWMLSGWRDVPRGGGGDCTNVALTASASTSLRLGSDREHITLLAPDVDLQLRLTPRELAMPPRPDEPHAMIRALLHAAQPPAGLELRCTAKGIPAATGLGTSAALQVTLVRVLAEAAGRTLSDTDLIYAARLPETYVLGMSCGFQDQSAAVHGGIANYHTRFQGDREAVEIRPLAVDPLLLETIDAVRAHGNPKLKVLGVLLTMYDPRTLHTQQVEELVREHFGDLVFSTPIRRSVAFDYATVAGEPLVVHRSDSAGAQAYMQIAQEVLDRA